MDNSRFDAFARSLRDLPSRRTVAGGLFAAVLSVTALRLPDSTLGRRKNKRKSKLQRNAYGCVDVGKPCRGKNANCCSGICEGKKPKKGKKDRSRCLAHHTADCPADADSCTGFSDGGVPCGAGGNCYLTTGKASFCASGSTCMECTRDSDCEPVVGPGGACIDCFDCYPHGTMCSPPAM